MRNLGSICEELDGIYISLFNGGVFLFGEKRNSSREMKSWEKRAYK